MLSVFLDLSKLISCSIWDINDFALTKEFFNINEASVENAIQVEMYLATHNFLLLYLQPRIAKYKNPTEEEQEKEYFSQKKKTCYLLFRCVSSTNNSSGPNAASRTEWMTDNFLQISSYTLYFMLDNTSSIVWNKTKREIDRIDANRLTKYPSPRGRLSQ